MSQYTWWSKWQTKEGRRWLGWLFYEQLLRLLPYPNWRGFFLKLGGAQLGERVFVHDVVFQNPYVDGFKKLKLDNRTTIQTQCLIDLADDVIMEEDVTLSSGVYILTHEDAGGKLGKPLAKYFKPKKAPVHIKKGSWIGARATILPGVTVGECSVVGAGSLVTKDVPDGVVVAGVPAKVMRRVDEQVEPVTQV